MSDFLTGLGSLWQFVRRVPADDVANDARAIIRHPTRIRVADYRIGRRAARIAEKMNEDVELH
jgi:hypothetical protein